MEYTPWPGLSHVEDFRAKGLSALASGGDAIGRQHIDRVDLPALGLRTGLREETAFRNMFGGVNPTYGHTDSMS